LNSYTPRPYRITPVSSYNKKLGYYFRYFYKTSNYPYSEPFEMDQIEYGYLKNNPMYDILRLKWCIRGQKDLVMKINKSVVEFGSFLFKGLKEKFGYDLLVNYDEFSTVKFENKFEMHNSNINIIIKEDPVNIYVGQLPFDIFMDIKKLSIPIDIKLQMITDYIHSHETVFTNMKKIKKKDIISIVYDDFYNVFSLTNYGLQIYFKTALE